MTNDLAKWQARSDLTDAAQQGGKVNGRSYFVPYGFYLSSLFYRKDLVSKAGFTPPHSWADVLKQAQALNDPSKNVYGYAFRGALHSDVDLTQTIETYVSDKLDPNNAFKLKDGSGTIFSTPEALQAVEMYLQLFKTASPPSAIDWDYPDQVRASTRARRRS